MIGTLGPNLIFTVSDDYVLTFSGMTRDLSSRWATHETPGVKPRAEFLGPGLQSVSLPITLSSNLGVKPREMLERVEQMVETGDTEYLILGCRPVGKNRFRVTGSSETWDVIYNQGELARAKLTLTLEEYA